MDRRQLFSFIAIVEERLQTKYLPTSVQISYRDRIGIIHSGHFPQKSHNDPLILSKI